MRRQAYLRARNFQRQRGFALAEIIVALFFVSMAVMLVGGLSQQVMNLSKSSKQTAAMIELRSKINSLTRNSDDWVHKMRVDPEVGSIYSGCIPDASVVSTSFNCPAVDASLLANDPELSRIAGPQMHAARVPIVDSMGEQIAGGDEPVYLDADGQICTKEPRATQCAFESTGYMLRTNSASNSNPGNVRFVVKVARNLQNVASHGMAAMKPQYMSIDMGTQWSKTLTGSCPSGSLKMGYLASGRPYCVKTMANCPSGQLALGVDSSGAAVCSSAPTSCSEGESVAYDPTSESIKCTAASSPCSNGKVFLGFYAGSQQAICMSADMSCPAGQVQVGFASSGGSVQASCAQVPTCSSSQVVAFNGNAFTCSNESEGVLCSDSQVLVGITKAGAPLCEPLIAGRDGVDGVAGRDGVDGTSIAIGQTCPGGQFVAGINMDGSVVCRAPASDPGGDGNDDAMGFVSMTQLPSFVSGSDDYEKQKQIWPLSCHVTSGAKVYQCGYVYNRLKVGGSGFNVATTDKNLESIGSESNFVTSRKCIFIDGKWKMQTSTSRYDRLCTGGVMYKKMNPAASRLDMRAVGHPEYNSFASKPRTIVPKGVFSASSTKNPTLAQLMAHFNSCNLDVSPPVNGDGVEDEHCEQLKIHLDKAKAYTDLSLAPQYYPDLTPQYCQAVNKDKKYYWTGCGSGCGVKLAVDYVVGQTPGKSGYKFKFQWSRNYAPPPQGSNFPLGTLCTGSSSTPATDRVRLAPSGLQEALENQSEDIGLPSADE